MHAKDDDDEDNDTEETPKRLRKFTVNFILLATLRVTTFLSLSLFLLRKRREGERGGGGGGGEVCDSCFVLSQLWFQQRPSPSRHSFVTLLGDNSAALSTPTPVVLCNMSVTHSQRFSCAAKTNTHLRHKTCLPSISSNRTAILHVLLAASC